MFLSSLKSMRVYAEWFKYKPSNRLLVTWLWRRSKASSTRKTSCYAVCFTASKLHPCLQKHGILRKYLWLPPALTRWRQSTLNSGFRRSWFRRLFMRGFPSQTLHGLRFAGWQLPRSEDNIVNPITRQESLAASAQIHQGRSNLKIWL